MYSLSLYFDTLCPGTKMDYIEAQHSICYIFSGSAVINGNELKAGEASYFRDYVNVSAGVEGAVIWRWEIERSCRPRNIGKGEGVSSCMRISREPQMFKLVPTAKWISADA